MESRHIASLQEIVSTEQHHLGWLDSVRGAAATYVVCHHAVRSVIVDGDNAHDVLFRLLQLATNYGHYAVDVFIVLSGYCLALPVLRNKEFGKALNFYLRRTIRIVLPYYAAILFTLLLTFGWLNKTDGVWASNALPFTWESLWRHLLLIHQWDDVYATKLNGAFWSVGVEYQIYLFFPFLYLAAEKFGYIKTFVLITIVTYSLWLATYNLNILSPGPNGASIYYCALFFMGVMAARFARMDTNATKPIAYLDKHFKSIALLAILGIGLLAAISFSINYFKWHAEFPLQIQSFFIGLMVSVLLLLKSRNPALFKTSWQWPSKAFAWIGVMGFSVYLLHDPALALVWSYVVVPLSIKSYLLQALVELLAGTSLTILLSMFFYKYIELPCHLLSKSIKQKTDAHQVLGGYRAQ